jgi:hypothetical protein
LQEFGRKSGTLTSAAASILFFFENLEPRCMLADKVNETLHTIYSILMDVMLNAFRIQLRDLLSYAQDPKEPDYCNVFLLN